MLLNHFLEEKYHTTLPTKLWTPGTVGLGHPEECVAGVRNPLAEKKFCRLHRWTDSVCTKP